MQRLQELKQYFGSNIGYTSMKLALGCGTVVAVSLLTTQYYMKWQKKRKITRIIDTFEEFQNGRVHIKYPDQVEDKVLQLIKGGSSKLQIVADFDRTLLPASYYELLNKINGVHLNRASDDLDGDINYQIPEEEYYPYKSEVMEKIIKPVNNMNGYSISNGKISDYKEEITKPLESVLRKGCSTFFDIILNHKIPLQLIIDQGEAIQNIISCLSEYPNVYPMFVKKQEKNSYLKDDLQKRPNIITLGDIKKSNLIINDSNTTLRIGFLEKEVDTKLLEYINKYDIVVTSEPCLEVVNVFLQRIV